MNDILATMQDCNRMDIEQILPEYPFEASDAELDYADGVEDYEKFKVGSLTRPNYPENEDYMAGWRWGEDNFFSPTFEKAAA